MPSSGSGSWRMVEEGDNNESFDTSVVPAPDEDDDDDDIKTNPATQSSPSALSSQGNSNEFQSSESQDSIRDFSRHQDDPNNIMRNPFRPSMPGVSGPELKMPTIDVSTGAYSTGSLRRNPRRRAANMNFSTDVPPPRLRGRQPQSYEAEEHDAGVGLLDLLPGIVRGSLVWAINVVGLALQYSQTPLAIVLAVYLSIGALIMAQNAVTHSVQSSLTPLCRIPGAVSILHLPFCPSADMPGPGGDPDGKPRIVEFDDLMGVQDKLEQVLETSAEGVSLPYEMKRSETAIRDLRTLVGVSNVPSREELVQEFDSYLAVSRRAASDLQRFNTHCGSTVDSVIAVNRWTARYIDSLSPGDAGSTSTDNSGGLVGGLVAAVFAPFLPDEDRFTERMILDKYVEHTAHVSERIAGLILEAHAVLGLLARAEDHLGLVHELTARDAQGAADTRSDVLWRLWTVVGGNRARLRSLSHQADLLRRVDAQRSDAVGRVSALVVELQAIQAGLEDLRDRVAAPALTVDVHGIPLAVHIETIDRGVERLEAARARITAAETARVHDALRRAGVANEAWLEG